MHKQANPPNSTLPCKLCFRKNVNVLYLKLEGTVQAERSNYVSIAKPKRNFSSQNRRRNHTLKQTRLHHAQMA